MKKGIMKKLCATILVIATVFVSVVPSFAEGSNSSEEDLVFAITGTDELNRDISWDNDSAIIADGYEMLLDIPADASRGIYATDGIGSEIKMFLPNDARSMSARREAGGTVTYSKRNGSVAYNIQPLQIEDARQSATIEGWRTSVIIQNSNAPKEYEFSFDLGSYGDRIVSSREFFQEAGDTGELYILDNENQIRFIIDAPWAKDALGNSVPTHYRIEGNSIVQVVEFDENTVFPVVADPTFWQVALCVTVVAGVLTLGIATIVNLLPAITGWIATMGGLKASVMLMMGCTTLAEKQAEIIKACKAFLAVLGAIQSVVGACPGIKATMDKLGISL